MTLKLSDRVFEIKDALQLGAPRPTAPTACDVFTQRANLNLLLVRQQNGIKLGKLTKRALDKIGYFERITTNAARANCDDAHCLPRIE